MTKTTSEHIVESIRLLMVALEDDGGQFLIELDGKEYTCGGVTEGKNEIVIHAFNE